jgi:RHS repeat-associated protein
VSSTLDRAELRSSPGLRVDMALLDELRQYVNGGGRSASLKQPLPDEYMDLNGDESADFDAADLAWAEAAGDEPVGEPRLSVTYHHADHLGSATHATTSSGQLISQQVFLAYGELGSRSGQEPLHGFTGMRRDLVDLGLVHMGAREYSPTLSRWLTPDRYIGESPKLMVEKILEANLYAYATGNPIRFIDPTGKDVEILVGGPYKAHGKEQPYGHVAVRVYGEGYDITYDFGRYGKTWGLGDSEGEGQMRVWKNAFSEYIKGENATGRTTTGHVMKTSREQDAAIMANYDKLLNGLKPNDSRSFGDGRGMQQFRLRENYHALRYNCTTVAVDAADGPLKVELNDKRFNEGRQLSMSEKLAAKIDGWPERVFMPMDLRALLDSEASRGSFTRVNAYSSGRK